MFRSLSNQLQGKKFNEESDLKKFIQRFFDNKGNDFCRRGITSLVEKWEKAVIIHEVKFFYDARGKKLAALNVTNHLLILNLAVADLLMGIYLLMLGIAGAVYGGIFCAQQLTWQSGITCQAMGGLVALSSEASVITMVMLASFRLFAVFKPFKASNKPSKRFVFFLILFAWFISFLIALLPFSTPLRFIFEDQALIEDQYFFRNVSVRFDSAKTWAEKLLTYDPTFMTSSDNMIYRIRDAASWPELQSLVANSSVAFALETSQYFGYYSVNSVCIPRIFVTSADSGWQFSITISIFNFLAFLFVACSYALIIYRTKKSHLRAKHGAMPKNNESTKMKAMQRKIYRLVVTDFCCWVPISIMAFVNISGITVSSTAYSVSAIVLLPINSALNPILYSDLLDKILATIRKFEIRPLCVKQSSVSSSTPATQESDTKL